MAIGDSLARGLGVFGAMAIIRFRTRISDPRDVLFLFAALSTGLAIGVYGFTISFVGTILFCAVAFLLHFSPFRSFVQHHHLFFSLPDDKNLERALIIIRKHCAEHRQMGVQMTKVSTRRYQYGISLRKNASYDKLLEELLTIEGISQVRVAINELNPQ